MIWFKIRVFVSTAGSLTQAIRNFAKSLEGWLKNAMQNVPEEMVKTKVSNHLNLNLRESLCKIF